MTLPFFDAATIRSALPFDRAIAALEDSLRNGIDPETDSSRLFSPAPGGQFLLMPTSGGRYSGVKVATIAPHNPARGLEKIQGVYLLFDSSSLAPLAAMDGTELTAIRTPATTLTAIKHLAASPGPEPFPDSPRVLVFGAGVQALQHIRAAQCVFPRASFTLIGQRPHRVQAAIRTLNSEGLSVTAGTTEVDVPAADIIICATSSPTPLFDGDLPSNHAIIAAIGQHGLEAREVDAALVRRSTVVVEGRESSWRESGNLIPARSTEEWRKLSPPNLRDLVNEGIQRTYGHPTLYTGVGMAWEDLVTASVVYETQQ